jgi:hypothetical protein
MDGASSNPAQKAFTDLLRGLFHWPLVRRWTRDTADKWAYSLNPRSLSKASPFFVGRPDTLSQPSVRAGVRRCHHVAEHVISIIARRSRASTAIEDLAESVFAVRSLRHRCRLVRKFPSSSLPIWRAWRLWPHTRTDAAPPTLVPQGSPRRLQPPPSTSSTRSRNQGTRPSCSATSGRGTVRFQRGGGRCCAVPKGVRPGRPGSRTEGGRRRVGRTRTRRGRRASGGWYERLDSDSQVYHGLNVFRVDFATETAGRTVSPSCA